MATSSWTATWSGDNCSLDLRAEGEIKFNAEATDIQSISSGGFFEVNLRQDDTLKQVKVTPSEQRPAICLQTQWHAAAV